MGRSEKSKSMIVVMALAALIVSVSCNKSRVNIYELPVEQQFEVAKKTFDRGDYYKAKNQFSVIVLNNPGSLVIEKAQFYLAESHFYEKEYILAIEEYRKLIRSLPRSEFVDDAMYRIGLCYYQLSPGYALDQEYTQKAISQFQQFLDEYPESELRPEVEEKLRLSWNKLAKKEFKTGELYRKMGYFDAAVISFTSLLERYPDSPYTAEALYWKGVCQEKMKEYEQAQESYETLMARYPSDAYAARAQNNLQRIQDKE